MTPPVRAPRGRRTTRRALRLLGATLVLAAAGLAVATPAHADTPQERAQALANTLAQLQRQAEVATEQYDAAQVELGRLVTQASLDDQAADEAAAADARSAAAAAEHVRELYMVGGPGPLYVQVVTHGSDLSNLQTGLLATRNVVARSRADAAVAAQRHAAAAAAAQRADALAARQTQLQALIADRAAAVRQALSDTQTALAAANAQVRQLAAQVAAARAAADSAAFAQQLAAALAASGGQSAGAPSAAASAAVGAALTLQGRPYLWGGNGPAAYDCSGMTRAAYRAAGVALPRTAAEQYRAGPHPTLGDLRPGDLLFWATDPADPATIYHVAIYAGDGQMVSANHTGDTVRLQPVWWSGFAGITRPAPGVGGASAVTPTPPPAVGGSDTAGGPSAGGAADPGTAGLGGLVLGTSG